MKNTITEADIRAWLGRRKRVRSALVGLAVAVPLVAVAAPGAASQGPPTTVVPPSPGGGGPVTVAPPRGVTPPTVAYGSRGYWVQVLQWRLRIGADGIFGPATRGAVVSFQRSRGLAADGIVGPLTWHALGY